MNTNEYGQVTFACNEIIDMLYAEQIVDGFVVETSKILQHNLFSDYFGVPKMQQHVSIQEPALEYHKKNSETWLIPQEYIELDIEKVLAEKLVSKNLTTKNYIDRLFEEMNDYKARNMVNVLKFLFYLMKTCHKHNIVTGIGRGSSVSSLVLHLLDVHHIDPVKYNLDYKEFLR